MIYKCIYLIFPNICCQLLCMYSLSVLTEIFTYLEKYGWINFEIRHVAVRVYSNNLLSYLSWLFFKRILLPIFLITFLAFSLALETKFFSWVVWLILSISNDSFLIRLCLLYLFSNLYYKQICTMYRHCQRRWLPKIAYHQVPGS